MTGSKPARRRALVAVLLATLLATLVAACNQASTPTPSGAPAASVTPSPSAAESPANRPDAGADGCRADAWTHDGRTDRRADRRAADRTADRASEPRRLDMVERRATGRPARVRAPGPGSRRPRAADRRRQPGVAGRRHAGSEPDGRGVERGDEPLDQDRAAQCRARLVRGASARRRPRPRRRRRDRIVGHQAAAGLLEHQAVGSADRDVEHRGPAIDGAERTVRRRARGRAGHGRRGRLPRR